MAKVCEMIVNRDYIRENNVDHPPRAYVSSARSREYMRHARAYLCVCARVCVCASVYAYVCVCGRDAFTHVCGKKAAGRVSAGGRT